MDEHPEGTAALGALPDSDQDVIVVCQGLICLGFLANDGKWRAARSRKELREVLGWRHIRDDDYVPTHWLKPGKE